MFSDDDFEESFDPGDVDLLHFQLQDCLQSLLKSIIDPPYFHMKNQVLSYFLQNYLSLMCLQVIIYCLSSMQPKLVPFLLILLCFRYFLIQVNLLLCLSLLYPLILD